jgi:hypothetical protein
MSHAPDRQAGSPRASNPACGRTDGRCGFTSERTGTGTFGQGAAARSGHSFDGLDF